ncbi:MAG TPA: hypothetical protein VHE55_02215 [Fimbriimonadaceae bacterium]|nr:hypothetical protein [Fimbriimonadaceae bacterium]
MLIAVAALAIQTVAPLRPTLSIGCSREIGAAVEKIAKLTEAKDFKGAAAALHLIPGRETNVAWDDQSVPGGSRYDFGRSRDLAMAEWGTAVGLTQFVVSKTAPDIAFSFVPDGGMTLEWSDDLSKPRLTVKIGVKKGDAPVDPTTVHNDVAYAIGTYLGITKLPLPGLLMSGVDDATQILRLSGIEAAIARDNVTSCEKVAEQVGRSLPVSSGMPSMEADPQPVKLGPIIQGMPIELSFAIKNTGAGTLLFRIIPDCSCFSTQRTQVLQPDKSEDAKARMDTTNFSGMVQNGLVRHNLYLLSNDPAHPVRQIPVEVKITPRYRLLPDRQVVIADDNGNVTYTAYLYAPADHPLTVTSAESQGLPGAVTFEPWSGIMADPDLNEGPLPRKGYKFTLKLKGIPDGMQLATNILIGTDDPNFAQISDQVFVQKGIIVLPPQVSLGEVGKAPRKRSFFVTRRGKPFSILSADVDSKHLDATFETTQTPGEFLVTVSYDGQAPKGDYHATVTITTDDPNQKTIKIPVTGTVR